MHDGSIGICMRRYLFWLPAGPGIDNLRRPLPRKRKPATCRRGWALLMPVFSTPDAWNPDQGDRISRKQQCSHLHGARTWNRRKLSLMEASPG